LPNNKRVIKLSRPARQQQGCQQDKGSGGRGFAKLKARCYSGAERSSSTRWKSWLGSEPSSCDAIIWKVSRLLDSCTV
jgi:hypothetical protein